MAIQTRRGSYTDFDPDKMLPGEWGTAIADDPSAKDGTAVYMCFSPGNTKRMATYEDMQDHIKSVTKEIADGITEQAEGVVQDIERRLEDGEFVGPEGPRGPAGGIEHLDEAPVVFEDYPVQEQLSSGDSVAELFGKISTFMKTMEEGGLTGGIMNKVYPVGSIYMSVNPNDPAELFGGIWSRWGSGRVPVGVDDQQDEFKDVEQIGGENMHVLTTAELAAHTHIQELHNHVQLPHSHSLAGHTHSFSSSTDAAGNHTHTLSGTTGGAEGNSGEVSTESADTSAVNQNTGESAAHNNLQPYVTCYMWKRIA